MRIGHGYDVHRLVKGRELILGGVKIPYELGLLGHSDADVLVHAIMDALLGASALGDIGHLFPEADENFYGANSIFLLKKVYEKIKNCGFRIINIDSTVIAEAPRLAPHILKMRENIAKTCNLSLQAVSVKATTEEKMGFTGERLGIKSYAICLID